MDTTTPTSSRITTSSINNSMKMVEVVCSGCIRPITKLPFYKCTASDDGCNFVLHASCTRLLSEFKTEEMPYTSYYIKQLPQVPKFM
ncbi:zinc finger, PHD-type containing protein, partial [Tanacetum coccineum]